MIGEHVSQKGVMDEDGLMNRITFANKMMQKPADFDCVPVGLHLKTRQWSLKSYGQLMVAVSLDKFRQ